MFKRKVQHIDSLLGKVLRDNGLETPLQQKRLMDSWETVTGRVVARYTADMFIRSQVLFVKLTNPALRSDIAMMKSQIVRRLNDTVGSHLIIDIRFY